MEKYLRFLQVILVISVLLIIVTVIFWYNTPDRTEEILLGPGYGFGNGPPDYKIELCPIQDGWEYSLKYDFIKLTLIGEATRDKKNILWVKQNGKTIKTYRFNQLDNYPVRLDIDEESTEVEEYSKTIFPRRVNNYRVYTDIFPKHGEYELKFRAVGYPPGFGYSGITIGESDWIKITIGP